MADSLIDIKLQPRMGLKRLFELTITGIRYRLFRSIMSVIVITVAIAFLMNMVTGGVIQRSVKASVEHQLSELKLAPFWVSRLTQRTSARALLTELSRITVDDPGYQDLLGFGKLSPEAGQSFFASAQQAQVYLDFFKSLDFSKRRLLIGKAGGLKILDQLTTDEGWAQFEPQIRAMNTVSFPTPIADFETFLSEWPATKATLKEVVKSRNQKVREIRAFLNNESPLTFLAGLDSGNGERLQEWGFHLENSRWPAVARSAQDALIAREMERSSLQKAVKQKIAGRLDMLPKKVATEDLWNMLDSKKAAAWYIDVLNEEKGETTVSVTPERLVEVAEDKQKETRLSSLVGSLGADEGGLFGIGQRMTWLLFVSLMVCTVGIANSMLMSVTERYREIATLKCLGALDGTILWIFVIEASLLGFAGGVVGVILGTFLAMGRMLAGYSGLVFAAFPGGVLFSALIVGILVGTFLAAIASIYPSWKAARLAPMEAMRIE